MAVAVTNLSAAVTGTPFRVGDVVRADVTLATTKGLRFNAVQVAMEFDAQELAPVTDDTGRTAITPTAANENRDGATFHLASGTFGSTATILRNTYAVVGTGGASGQARFDAGVALPASGATAAIDLSETASPVVVGSIYLRVLNNPASASHSLTITLRDSAANDARYGLVALVDAEDGGYNVLGPVTGATLEVAHTTVGARLVVATPQAGSIRRVGDVVPVRLALDATTTVRNARGIRATITYPLTSLGLVSGRTGEGGAPPSFAASGTFSPDLAGSILGVAGQSATTHTLGASTGTIQFVTEGGPLDLAEGASDVTVATLYFRALDRGDLPLTLDSVQVGDHSLDGSASQATVAFPVEVTTTASATVAAVRGSVGAEVAVVGSPLAQADGTPDALAFGSTTTGTFTVTDGRFIDIEVRALAGAADAQAVNRVAIDVSLPVGLTLAPSANYVIAPGIVADSATAGEPAVTSTTGATPATISVRARVSAGAPAMHAPTAIARVRLAVATSTFTSSPSAIALAIATTTSLTQTGTRFVSNVHDDAIDPARSPLDVLPSVTRQPPATVTIPLRLQGRTSVDPPSRFVQAIEAFLAAPGATTAARRHATSVPPEALALASAGTMRYLATSAVAAEPANAAITLPDLDPGSYDLFVKGRSSLRARVAQVTLQPGDINTGALTGPVTLLEGDADRSDAINIGDFVVLATTYASPATSNPEDDSADFNQSGYVDAFDFSLLARNYAARGPITFATLAVDPEKPLPTHLAKAETTTPIFTIAIPIGENLTSAKVSVAADARLGMVCANPPPANTTCAQDAPTRVTLTLTPSGGASGGTSVAVGAVSLIPTGVGSSNLTATIIEAKGTNAAGKSATYRAPSITATIVVDPDVLYGATVQNVSASDPAQGGITAGASVTSNSAAVITGGTISVTWDPTRLHVATTEPCAVLADVTSVSCDWTTPGLATFTITSPGLPANAVVNLPVPLAPVLGAPPGSTTIHVQVAGLIDGMTDPVHVARALTAAPTNPGDDVATVTIGVSGDPSVATVTANRIRLPTVRARRMRPTTGTWLAAPVGRFAPGAVVPVDVRLATETPVDAAQVVLRVGDGFQIVGADGLPATRDTVIVDAGASPLPVTLRRAIDGATGLVELAFGRQVGQGAGGATGDGRIGTIFLKVLDAPGGAIGPALTIVQSSGGAFASVVVGSDGTPIASAGAVAWIEIDPSASPGTTPDLGAPVGTVDPIIGPPAPTGVVDAGTGAGVTPPANGARPALPASAATGQRVSVTPFSTTVGRASAPSQGASGSSSSSSSRRVLAADLAEDRASGTLTLSVPGRAPVQLRTGFATTEPDAWCPVARHQTYIRLKDVGIAGATFGVESGGVLEWVTPDQAGCVDWGAIDSGNLTFTKETIMQFELARAAPGALLWALGGARDRELYEVDATGTARYVTAEAFTSNRDHFSEAWANVIPVSSAQIDGLVSRGVASR